MTYNVRSSENLVQVFYNLQTAFTLTGCVLITYTYSDTRVPSLVSIKTIYCRVIPLRAWLESVHI
jgi:hypothetical protein